ncbi:MAG: hypothetical protein A2271_04985 [Candidatus Moranbacteria bacterium RIFOXYA12_FULL_35_19]|nr:MAG: hypothetical protein UR78_C0025G0003 [Candidatus Moranbacteria bacterium GW2011_GWF2_35_39]OGI32944.1 MAG: hypothetical protein A2489_00840 [Candidatus Moranbacteria bacterium RIFOXYC12_FULL_36_13]OGI36220.1 MAG: hypothetical protein A2271_04985 [Candidatus Moranbacteria bacterium RIFOXYA12_FULL_35_19]
MSPIQEQMDLPLEIEPKKKELTQEEMHEVWLKAKARGPEMIKKIREDHKKRIEKEWEEEKAKSDRKRWEESHKEGDGSDYEKYLEMEKIKALWGPASYPLSRQRQDTGVAERVKVYFGSNGQWYANEEAVSEAYALNLIKNDEEDDDYRRIIKEIEEIKKNLKNNSK